MGKVAVTGATGFIGSAVVRQLVRDSREVVALIEPGANTKNLDDLNVERVSVDVNDTLRLTKILAGFESLYHLAAIYRVWTKNPESIYRVNVEGTVSMLLAAQTAKIKRIVYTSSIAAIGLVDQGVADESTEFNLFEIANDYILSKWQSDCIARRFAQVGLPVVIVNPGFPFGPRDIGPTPTGKIVLAIMNGQVPGRGPGGLCAIDVDDCAAGHLLAEEKGRTGERYILGNHNISMNDLFDMVAKVASVPSPKIPIPKVIAPIVGLGMELWADHVSKNEPPATYRAVRYAQRYAYFSNKKAARELGLPSRPLEDSLRRAVNWFRAANMSA